MNPSALRSLLLAGSLLVSTQQAVSLAAKAAVYQSRLAFVLWGWTIGVGLVAIAAVWAGVDRAIVAGAAALAFGPGLSGFILLPRLCHAALADAGLIGAWLLMAAGMVASVGASTPLAVTFVLAPAWALALGRRWVPETAALAVLLYALGAGIAAMNARVVDLGVFAEMLCVVSLVVAAALMALGQAPSRAPRAMGERIAEVSHELRTPLTHILGFSEMIERQLFGPLTERYVEYAGLIRKSGNHLLGLVNDLLDLSKIDAGRFELERERFDARDVVADVVRLSLDSAERKSIALGMNTPDAPLNVLADERALRRILINTIGNAIKFTPEGGRVLVDASVEEGALVLDTIDNGPGIPETERERLGQAFERGASAGRAEGTGLGLALVRALAALHGGALSFHDAPGGGALVRVRLPVLA